MLTMRAEADEGLFGWLAGSRNALRPAVGLAGASRACLRLAPLQIGAQLLGEARLALVLRRIAGFVVPHVPFRAWSAPSPRAIRKPICGRDMASAGAHWQLALSGSLWQKRRTQRMLQ